MIGDPVPQTPSPYAWFADDELLMMMNRYVERAPSAELASTRLKVWLAQQCLPASRPAACVEVQPAKVNEAQANAKSAPGKIQIKAPPSNAPPAARPLPATGVTAPGTGRIRMSREEAAQYLGRTVSTLSNWAHKRMGPPYYRKGGVHYFQDELDAWRAKPAFAGD